MGHGILLRQIGPVVVVVSSAASSLAAGPVKCKVIAKVLWPANVLIKMLYSMRRTNLLTHLLSFNVNHLQKTAFLAIYLKCKQ